MFKPGPTVSVEIEGYKYVTSGPSLYAAVAHAMEVFDSDWWKGPKPNADTMFEVRVVSQERTYRVSARRVMEWRAVRRQSVGVGDGSSVSD